MKTHSRILAAAVATIALFLGSCSGGDSHEKVVDDLTVQLDRMATAIGSVADKASAEKAVTDMKSIVGDMKKIATRAKSLGQPSANVRAKLEAKLKAKEDDLQQKMAGSQAAMMKAGPEAAGILMKGMMELAPSLNEMADIFSDADKK